MHLELLQIPVIHFYAFENPGNGLAEAILQYRHTGLADCRQTLHGPRTRTTLPQLTHQDTVRQEDHVQVPRLALATAKLTVTHAHMLLAVPMEALSARPTVPIDPQNPCEIPMNSIRHQDLLGLLVVLLVPEDYNPYLMVYRRYPHALGEHPLSQIADHHQLATVRLYPGSHLLRLHLSPLELHLPVELQVPHIRTAQTVNMVEVLCTGKPAIKGEIPRDTLAHSPIYQPTKEYLVVLKRNLLFLATLPLNETTELQRIMFPSGTDVVDDQVVMGDLIPLFGVIPEVTDVLDQGATMINQDIVYSNDSLGAVAGIWAFLEPVEPTLIELLGVPLGFGEPALQTRLVCGEGELAVYGRDVLLVGYHQSCEVFGEMATFGLIAEHRAELLQGLLDDGRVVYNGWHSQVLLDLTKASTLDHRHFAHLPINYSSLQKFSS